MSMDSNIQTKEEKSYKEVRDYIMAILMINSKTGSANATRIKVFTDKTIYLSWSRV